MIGFLHLTYFLTVVEEKSITKAAQKLHISQQALSNHISKIEKQLEIKLFERSVPVKLTHEGEVFKAYASKLLSYQHEMFSEISDIKNNKTGQIRFGISYNRGEILLPKILPAFKKAYPFFDFYIVEGNHNDLQNLLLSGKIDLIIEQLPFSEEISYIELCSDNLSLLVTDDFLEKQFESTYKEEKEYLFKEGRISHLTNCPFLLNKTGNSIRKTIDILFQFENIQPVIGVETENMTTLLNICTFDTGITVFPNLFLPPHTDIQLPDNLNVIPLKYTIANYTLAIGYRPNHYFSASTIYFINLIKDLYGTNRGNLTLTQTDICK